MLYTSTETTKEFILELPDENDTFPSSIIRRSAERSSSSSTQQYHKHPLILVDSTNKEEAYGDLDFEVCDVCIQPIHISTSQFYKCQFDGCHFLAHDICAYHLPSSLQVFYAGNLLKNVVPIQEYFSYSSNNFLSSVFPCLLCFRPSNGFGYALLDEEKLWGFCDAECMFAPKIIKHASHRQHLIFQITAVSKTSVPFNCCSRGSLHYDVYKCIICDFNIHIRCALLPKKTRHKFDEHPLELITRPHHDGHEDNEKQVLFCEVCEQEIELNWWYYGCYKCEQYFHIDCIPSVGHTSKVKFGKTHVDYKLHQHPLTLTRMLTHERHERCGVCNQIIQAGFGHDQMTFHCSHCDFWVHFSSASTTLLMDYTGYLNFFEQGIKELKEKLP